MVLNGRIYVNASSGQGPNNRPVGSRGQRSASGGTPPYTYSSSDTKVASVHSSNGMVLSTGNGSAIITVRDTAGQTLRYTVNVSGVIRMTYRGQWQFASAFRIATNEATLREIYNQYGGGGITQAGFPGGIYFTSNSEHHPWPIAKGVYINMDNGAKGWEPQLGRSFHVIQVG
ncbi:hypothetical protein D3C81_1500720 [compost metagenome]